MACAASIPSSSRRITGSWGCEKPPSVNGVRKLITQNGISFLQTSYGAPSEALIPILQQNKILTFNGGGASPKQLFADYLWMTRMVFAYDPTPGALTWIAENYPDAKRLATIGTLENGVEALEQLVPKVWPEVSSGGEIVAKEIHDVGLTDFSQVIARVKSSNPDAIFTVTFGNDLGYLVKQFREAAVEVPIVGIEFTQDAQVSPACTLGAGRCFQRRMGRTLGRRLLDLGREGRCVPHRIGEGQEVVGAGLLRC